MDENATRAHFPFEYLFLHPATYLPIYETRACRHKRDHFAFSLTPHCPVMNTDNVVKPAEHLVQNLIDDAETIARKEPAKAVAAAMGLGLMLNLLPTRFLVATVTAITVTVLRPALLTLGVVKAFELCQSPNKPLPPR